MPFELPPAARQYRAAMWLFALLAIAAVVPVVQGIRGVIPRTLGLASGGISVASFFLAATFGLRGRRLLIEAREREAARLALVMLAGVLKDRGDDELEALARQQGTAAEAARSVLGRRREDRDRATRRQAPPA
ncbi:MAG TPA: hypothetical protein VGR60_07105 [Gemmatimonadales bacterium]|nr:hypothetical protein [Gemmatimonadales bacterium]